MTTTSQTFSFWTKAYLNSYKKEKGDADHCPYTDLLCFLIVIPKFTLNYCCFALLKILRLNYLGGQKNFVHQIGRSSFQQTKILFSLNYFSHYFSLQTEPEINYLQGSNLKLLIMALCSQNSSIRSFFLERKIPFATKI